MQIIWIIFIFFSQIRSSWNIHNLPHFELECHTFCSQRNIIYWFFPVLFFPYSHNLIHTTAGTFAHIDKSKYFQQIWISRITVSTGIKFFFCNTNRSWIWNSNFLSMFHNNNSTFSVIICMNQCIGNSFAECIMYIHTIHTYSISSINKWHRNIIIYSIGNFVEKIKQISTPVTFVWMCPIQPSYIFIITFFSVIQKIIRENISNSIGISKHQQASYCRRYSTFFILCCRF